MKSIVAVLCEVDIDHLLLFDAAQHIVCGAPVHVHIARRELCAEFMGDARLDIPGAKFGQGVGNDKGKLADLGDKV